MNSIFDYGSMYINISYKDRNLTYFKVWKSYETSDWPVKNNVYPSIEPMYV